MKQYLTIEGLSKKIHFSKKTLYNWCQTGKIPHFKVEHKIMFDAADIEAWMDSHKLKQTKGKP